MNSQQQLGKAFEYACVMSFFIHLSEHQKVVIEQNSSLNIAKQKYNEIDDAARKELDLAADAAVPMLRELEPRLDNSDDDTPLTISMQSDNEGITGDVRDILFIRKQQKWEIGISVKHNHGALKHSRLSKTLDFGKSWFGVPCSDSYFNKINPIFSELQKQKDLKRKWLEVENKGQSIYWPLLEAFIEEVKLINATLGDEAPKRMLSYLLGRRDFYKVIAKDSSRSTELQGFPLYGTLNKPSHSTSAVITLPQLKLPSKILDISFKPSSNTTVIITFNEEWSLSFRIHNASTFVETSLKFDVQFVNKPEMYTESVPWN